MRKTFQYRLYPTKSQLRGLEAVLEECRWVYNETLAQRKNLYELTGISLGLYDTQNFLPFWKEKRPALKTVHSQVLQQAQIRVDLAMKAFFRRVKTAQNPGYPRFKGKGRYDSFTFTQAGFSVSENAVKISKVGEIKAVIHRPIEGKVKTLTIRRTSTGKWFACFSCELPDVAVVPVTIESSVGIDLGVTTFAVMSNGDTVENPRVFKTYAKRLARVTRRREALPKGSAQRNKARIVESKVHERIANVRKDFAHKTALSVVRKYDLIVLEDLNTKNMLENNTTAMSRSIADVAWNQFVQFTQYKAASAGKRVILVDPRNTTKECSRCGMLIPKDLSERVHRCTCGLEMGRDLNAAINIVRRGLASVGLNRPRSPHIHVGE